MKQFAYTTLLRDARRAIDNYQLKEVLDVVATLVEERPNWEISEKARSVENAYKRMLDFLIQGGEDTQRKILYLRFLRQASELIEELFQKDYIATEGTFYHRVGKTLDTMGIPTSLSECLTQKVSIRILFERIFTSTLWTLSDLEGIQSYLQETDETTVALLLSATMLGALVVFDAQKVSLLLDFITDKRPLVRVRALVGFFFIFIAKEKYWKLYPELTERMERLQKEVSVTREIRRLQLQVFISSHTKAIQKRMQEEILPSILETSKKLKFLGGIDETNFIENLSKLSENPAWEQKGLLSKVSDSMREIQELQQQGADVYLGSFSAMKVHFPFFTNAVNWFYPFTVQHPELKADNDMELFFETLAKTSSFCNSDKYSLAFLLQTLPVAQKKVLTQQMIQAFAVNKSSQGESLFDIELRVYLQDLYRFFTLFELPERKSINLFEYDLLFAQKTMFAEVFADKNILLELADLLFKQKNYGTAMTFFERAAEFELKEVAVAVELFQKWGYSSQSMKDYEKAIIAYERVLLFLPEDAWTLYLLSVCYQAKGERDKALETARHLLEIEPNHKKYLLFIAQLYFQRKEYEQARNYLLKLVYLEEEAGEAVRALAWCELLLGNNAGALVQYQKLFSQSQATDFMNAGHAAWLSGNTELAIRYYKEFLNLIGKTSAETSFFEEDKILLKERGKEELDQIMMIDMLNQLI